ncbi:MAG TPA: AgmX/PglI C-terminal domain-containing protein [Polyangiaceae bacterium]|nr:AgmX/PglI C-terminal domain-containing protein [Polyangiaceae bacterium]
MQRSVAQRVPFGAPYMFCLLAGLGCASRGADVRAPDAELATPAQPGHVAATQADKEDAPAPQAQPAAREARRRLPWLGPTHIGAAVREHEAAFAACQTLGDAVSRGQDGAFTVGWLVDANGSVAEVSLARSSFESPLVNECMLSVARQVTFPASASPSQVSWTVRLQATDGGALAEAARSPSRR